MTWAWWPAASHPRRGIWTDPHPHLGSPEPAEAGLLSPPGPGRCSPCPPVLSSRRYYKHTSGLMLDVGAYMRALEVPARLCWVPFRSQGRLGCFWSFWGQGCARYSNHLLCFQILFWASNRHSLSSGVQPSAALVTLLPVPPTSPHPALPAWTQQALPACSLLLSSDSGFCNWTSCLLPDPGHLQHLDLDMS